MLPSSGALDRGAREPLSPRRTGAVIVGDDRHPVLACIGAREPSAGKEPRPFGRDTRRRTALTQRTAVDAASPAASTSERRVKYERRASLQNAPRERTNSEQRPRLRGSVFVLARSTFAARSERASELARLSPMNRPLLLPWFTLCVLGRPSAPGLQRRLGQRRGLGGGRGLAGFRGRREPAQRPRARRRRIRSRHWRRGRFGRRGRVEAAQGGT